MKNESTIAPADLPVQTPELENHTLHTDANAAVAALQRLYAVSTGFLRDRFAAIMAGEPIKAHYRAFYPEVRFFTSSYAKVNSRLAYGHFSGPGEYATTITRPDLFADYLKRQIGLIIANHGVPAAVGYSQTPIPLHFAFAEGHHVEGSVADRFTRPLARRVRRAGPVDDRRPHRQRRL